MTVQRLPTTRSLCILCALVSFSASGAAQAQCQYEVQTWGPWMCAPNLPNSYTSLGLNNLGGWVGYRFMCWPGEGYLPVYCPAGSTPQVLPMPSGAGLDGARAKAVNDAGVVVGWYLRPPYNLETACIWWPDGDITTIWDSPTVNRSYANAVSNGGIISGTIFFEVGPLFSTPFVLQGGNLTLIDPAPFVYGSAIAVSDSGFVGGVLGAENSNGRAYRWSAGRLTILEPIDGHPISVARGMNDQGWIVGDSRTNVQGVGYIQTPTLWTLTGAMPLPAPPGYVSGAAGRVNNEGVISGAFASNGPGFPTLQVVWINGEVYPLNTLTVPGSPNIGSVVAINSVGQILSGGSAKLLTPIGATASDLNGDCAVNGADLALILSEWGPVLQPGSACDINGDGTVNGADLGLLLSAWSP